jgi:hypothetical protein
MRNAAATVSLTVAVILAVPGRAIAANRLLAVLPLDVSHAKGKLDPDAQASVEEMLRDVATTALTPQGWVILTGENMLQVLKDNCVDPARCGDESCHLSMAREIKAEKFLSGAVQYGDDEFTASIRLIDSASGRILASERLEAGSVKALRRAFETKANEFFVRGGLGGGAIVTPLATTGTVSVAAGVTPGAVPVPPTVITGDGLGLDADADVLVAYDQALKAEKTGEANPAVARDAWARLASMATGNPYRKLATDRAAQWGDYAQKLETTRRQHAADLEKLRKVLPLESLGDEQKAQLLANFVGNFGSGDLPALLTFVPPGLWRGVCSRLPANTSLNLKVRVEAKDDEGSDVAAGVLVGDRKVGQTPIDVTGDICTDARIGVTELSSGHWWETPLLPAGGAPTTTRTAVFRATGIRRHFDAATIVWASGASASAQYSDSNWSAQHAAGAPDTPQCGDFGTAWATREADATGEWLELSYASPTEARGVRIVETFNPGAVAEVLVRENGDWVRVWSGQDQTSACPGNLDVMFGSVRTVTGVRVNLHSESTPGWNEIDAVGLAPP